MNLYYTGSIVDIFKAGMEINTIFCNMHPASLAALRAPMMACSIPPWGSEVPAAVIHEANGGPRPYQCTCHTAKAEGGHLQSGLRNPQGLVLAYVNIARHGRTP